nr:MAG TPA: hypothetical protein [Caudoviricetes sp.]
MSCQTRIQYNFVRDLTINSVVILSIILYY